MQIINEVSLQSLSTIIENNALCVIIALCVFAEQLAKMGLVRKKERETVVLMIRRYVGTRFD